MQSDVKSAMLNSENLTESEGEGNTRAAEDEERIEILTPEKLPSDFVSIKNECMKDDDLENDLSELTLNNEYFKPFRNEDSHQHTNSHLLKSRRTCASGMSSTTSISQEQIKLRVKKGLSKEKKAVMHRRLVKGESSLITKQRRELANDVKLGCEVNNWFG